MNETLLETQFKQSVKYMDYIFFFQPTGSKMMVNSGSVAMCQSLEVVHQGTHV